MHVDLECRKGRYLRWLAIGRMDGPLAVVVLLLGSACSTSEDPADERKTGKLVEQAKWVLLETGDDPFLSERPADSSCPTRAAQYDEITGWFEVDTRYCDYVSVHQPSLLDVKAGDKIYMEGYRGKNSAAEPAEAHIAITLNGVTLFDRRYSIPCLEATAITLCPAADDPCNQPHDPSPPCDSGLQPTAIAPADAPAGSPVIFHVHNHGENYYALIQMNLSELAP